MIRKIKSKYSPGFWRLCAGTFFFFASFNLIIPELSAHVRSLGGEGSIGFIIPAFALSALLARPFSAFLTDRNGRKLTSFIGAAVCVIASCIYPIIGALAPFFILRIFHGFSTGFTPTGASAFVADLVPIEQRGEALGIQGMSGNLGTAFGFGTGSLLAQWLGRDGMYLVSALIALLATWMFAGMKETLENKIKYQTKDFLGMKKADVFLRKSWKPALLMFCVCVGFGSILTVMPEYTASLGFANKGLFLLVYISFSLTVRVWSGKLSDTYGRAFSVSVGTTSQVISLVLLTMPGNTFSFFASALFYGIGQGFNAPGLFAWAADSAEKNERGKALSSVFISLEAGIILGGVATGQILQWIPNGYTSVFAFNLIFIAAACVLANYWRIKRNYL